MPFMLLIVEPVDQRRERGLEGGQDAYREMLEFTARLDAAGVLKASDSLGTRARVSRSRKAALACWTARSRKRAK